MMESEFGITNLIALRLKNNSSSYGILAVAFTLLCLAIPTSVVAHSGGLDKNGCHNNNTKHNFECHEGLLKGQTFKSREEAMKALEKKKKEVAASRKAGTSTPKAQTTQKQSPTGGK